MMYMFKVAVLLWLTGLAMAEVIGTIGNRTEEGDTQFEPGHPRSDFYLNTNAPATANGTISSIQYCYTLDTSNSENIDIYLTTVGIYRPVGNSYTLINSTVLIFDHNADQFPPDIDNTYHCTETNIAEFEVQTGDVIGVCMARSQRTEIVNVYAEGLAGGSIVRSSNSDTCSSIGMAESSVSVAELREVQHEFIRIFANIAPGPGSSSAEDPVIGTTIASSTGQRDETSDGLTRLEVIIIVVGSVVTVTVLGFCVLLCAVLIKLSKRRRTPVTSDKTVNSVVHNEDDAATFPNVRYHQVFHDSSTTTTRSDWSPCDIPPQPPETSVTPSLLPLSPQTVLSSPSYATVSPLEASEHIVYEDSFEYTQSHEAVHWSKIENHDQNLEMNTLGRDARMQQSLVLVNNAAYGCDVSSSRSTNGLDNPDYCDV